MTHRGPFQARPFCDSVISQTAIKDYSLGIVTEIWMGRSQNSGGDLEMVEGGSELKWKVKHIWEKVAVCSLPVAKSFEDTFLGYIRS